MKKDIRVALVSCESIAGNKTENLNRIFHWTALAADYNAQIVAFPELSLTGYLPEPKAAEMAESVPGPSTRALADVAVTYQVQILAGLVELATDSRIYATHVVISPDGSISKYRKLHIPPPEKGVFHPGSSIPLFQGPEMRFGIQLCYDAHFAELTTVMAMKGAHLIFIPHASPRGTAKEKYQSWMRHLPARAFDNGLYVAAWNQNGTNGKELQFPGLSIVLDPFGKPIDTLTISDVHGFMDLALIKPSVIRSVRNHRMRYFLPNHRPDLYANAFSQLNFPNGKRNGQRIDQ